MDKMNENNKIDVTPDRHKIEYTNRHNLKKKYHYRTGDPQLIFGVLNDIAARMKYLDIEKKHHISTGTLLTIRKEHAHELELLRQEYANVLMQQSIRCIQKITEKKLKDTPAPKLMTMAKDAIQSGNMIRNNDSGESKNNIAVVLAGLIGNNSEIKEVVDNGPEAGIQAIEDKKDSIE